jgi:hypothetical protein
MGGGWFLQISKMQQTLRNETSLTCISSICDFVSNVMCVVQLGGFNLIFFVCLCCIVGRFVTLYKFWFIVLFCRFEKFAAVSVQAKQQLLSASQNHN